MCFHSEQDGRTSAASLCPGREQVPACVLIMPDCLFLSVLLSSSRSFFASFKFSSLFFSLLVSSSNVAAMWRHSGHRRHCEPPRTDGGRSEICNLSLLGTKSGNKWDQYRDKKSANCRPRTLSSITPRSQHFHDNGWKLQTLTHLKN